MKNVNICWSCFWFEACLEKELPHHVMARISHSCPREENADLFGPMREKVIENAVCQVRTSWACCCLSPCDYQKETKYRWGTSGLILG